MATTRRELLAGIGASTASVALAVAPPRPGFAVGPVKAAPGEKASGFLTVPAAKDEGTRVPVTVVAGARPGPVVAFVAGVHGSEYAPVVALQRLLPRLDARQLSGTVVLVHVANPPSFHRRAVYYSPIDGKNLNRVFPGRANGTHSERLAHALTREVIARADYVLDLHAGESNEALRPYTGYNDDHPDPKVVERSRGLALAFGIDHIKLSRGRPKDPAAAVFLSNAASLLGKPALAVESGELGRSDPEAVDRVVRGALSVLRHLKVLDGKPGRVERPVFLDRDETVRGTDAGLFYPAVERGRAVRKGALLGRVTDYFGAPLQDVRAPFDGVVLYILAAPPVSPGEAIGSIARVAESAPGIRR